MSRVGEDCARRLSKQQAGRRLAFILSFSLWCGFVSSHFHTRSQKLCVALLLCLQIYFLPDPLLSPIPFSALKVGEHFLIEKVLVAQASSLRTLDCARIRWDTICDEPSSSPAPEVGPEALMVMYNDFDLNQSLKEQCEELSRVLPAETLSDSSATKKNVIERVTSGSASLVHFLVHGTPGGRADRRWYESGWETPSLSLSLFSLPCILSRILFFPERKGQSSRWRIFFFGETPHLALSSARLYAHRSMSLPTTRSRKRLGGALSSRRRGPERL